MNNNQICNEKTKVKQGIAMNEKDYLTNLLTTLKDIEKNYCIAITEASCENLYQKYLKSFLEIDKLQRQTYELMFQNGWYCLEKAENKKIQTKYDTLNQEYQDLKK